MPPHEPPKLEIVFEEHPVQLKKKSPAWKWERLLAPVKAAPGCEARVRTHPARHRADAEIRRMKDRLEQVDPFGEWEIHVYATPKECEDGRWGVYVTYRGQMTPAERDQKLLERKQRQEKMRQMREVKRLKNALKEVPNQSVADITQITRTLGQRR